MLNYLWALMVLIGIVVGICNGNIKELGNGALEAAGGAVTLAITMLGIMSLWMGLMQIARASGLLERMTKAMRPLIRFLFPHLPAGSLAGEYIATNMIANFLGLGWAATPAGLKAMEALAGLEARRGNPEYLEDAKPEQGVKRRASNEMCTFLILNISSLQLIPINMIAYRSQYGSANPAGIIVPAIMATLASTAVAVVFCKVKGCGTKQT